MDFDYNTILDDIHLLCKRLEDLVAGTKSLHDERNLSYQKDYATQEAKLKQMVADLDNEIAKRQKDAQALEDRIALLTRRCNVLTAQYQDAKRSK